MLMRMSGNAAAAEAFDETLADSWEQCSPAPANHLVEAILQQHIPCAYGMHKVFHVLRYRC